MLAAGFYAPSRILCSQQASVIAVGKRIMKLATEVVKKISSPKEYLSILMACRIARYIASRTMEKLLLLYIEQTAATFLAPQVVADGKGE